VAINARESRLAADRRNAPVKVGGAARRAAIATPKVAAQASGEPPQCAAVARVRLRGSVATK